MKRGTSVRVTDPQSANFGKVGTFLFRANQNYVHVNIDGITHTFHRLAVEPIQYVKISNKHDSYTPPIQDEVLRSLYDKLKALYNDVQADEVLSGAFDTDYARGVNSQAKKVREQLYNILNGVQ